LISGEVRKKISQQQLESSVTVQNIGGHQLTYSNEFDLISMSVTLHEIIPPDLRPMVLEKAYEALKPGGFLMILDFPYPNKIEDVRNPMYDMGIFDQFYETVMGTVHLTTDEQAELLTRVGFKDIKRMNIGKGMFEFVTATK